MKLRHFALCALSLLPISFSAISAIDTAPANANTQTNGLWKQYLGGRKIVNYQRYSSGNGGGGITATTELHFCRNGQYIYRDQNSFTVNAGNSNINSGGQNGNTGTWKIMESNRQAVAIEVKSNSGQIHQFVLIDGTDERGRKLYSNGNKFLPGPSEICP
jgi:hypothetical protein